MSERWILNASPLIVLAHIRQTLLIAARADEAVVPEAVAAEILAGPTTDPARRWIEAGAVRVTLAPAASAGVATPPPMPELLAWDLGAGETAVLAQALATPGWRAVLDDAAARKCARSFSIPVLGTRAIIVRARQQGLIPSAAEAIRALRTAGFRIDAQLVRTGLWQTLREAWPADET